MAQVFGIDLGTTYSVIATLDENSLPKVIDNQYDSMPLLASAVYFPEGGEPVVGKEAKAQIEIEPKRVVQFVKRQIGKPDAQTWEFDGVTYDPTKISALILKRMKAYAEEQGWAVNDVVITCPAYFGNEEKAATKQAGELAGFNVLNIVNEPTAAALNYCAREFAEKRKMMVYDLGGGTFDVTLFDFDVDESGKASIDILGVGGDDRLGGIDWDSRLFDYICALYEEESGVGKDLMDAELKQRLRTLVEETKQSLSSLPTKNFTVQYAGDAIRLSATRDKFEELTQDLVGRTLDLVRQTLTEAALTPDAIDIVLMVGGSTLMPMIKTALEGVFPGKTKVEEPNLAVAKGAALAAAIAWNETIHDRVADPASAAAPGEPAADGSGEPVLTEEQAADLMIPVPHIGTVSDKLTRSLGPAVFSNDEWIVDNLLFVGDEDGTERSQIYGTRRANQPNVAVKVFENVSRDRENSHVQPCEDPEGNPAYPDPALKVKKIGVVTLPLPPNTPADTPIEVFFRSSTVGLEVRATNLSTGESVDAVITSENTLNEEQFEAAKAELAGIRTAGQI